MVALSLDLELTVLFPKLEQIILMLVASSEYLFFTDLFSAFQCLSLNPDPHTFLACALPLNHISGPFFGDIFSLVH